MSEAQRTNRGCDATGRLTWFLTGAVIGAAVGLLYAPRSGRETRRMITRQGEAVADAGKDIAEAGRDMFERGRQLVEDAADLFERGRRLVKG